MIQSRFVSVLILISLLLMNSLSLSAQNVTFTKEDFKNLLEEYQTLKEQWKNSGVIILALEKSLNEAKESQGTSSKKIYDLEQALLKALNYQASLERHILDLEKQLTELGVYLTNTLEQLKSNEGAHAEEIISIVSDAAIREQQLKNQRNILIVVTIIEAIIIGVGICLSR